MELAEGQIWQHAEYDDITMLICGFSTDGTEVLVAGSESDEAEWWDVDELVAELEGYEYVGTEEDD